MGANLKLLIRHLMHSGRGKRIGEGEPGAERGNGEGGLRWVWGIGAGIVARELLSREACRHGMRVAANMRV